MTASGATDGRYLRPRALLLTSDRGPVGWRVRRREGESDLRRRPPGGSGWPPRGARAHQRDWLFISSVTEDSVDLDRGRAGGRSSLAVQPGVYCARLFSACFLYRRAPSTRDPGRAPRRATHTIRARILPLMQGCWGGRAEGSGRRRRGAGCGAAGADLRTGAEPAARRPRAVPACTRRTRQCPTMCRSGGLKPVTSDPV